MRDASGGTTRSTHTLTWLALLATFEGIGLYTSLNGAFICLGTILRGTIIVVARSGPEAICHAIDDITNHRCTAGDCTVACAITNDSDGPTTCPRAGAHDSGSNLRHTATAGHSGKLVACNPICALSQHGRYADGGGLPVTHDSTRHDASNDDSVVEATFSVDSDTDTCCPIKCTEVCCCYTCKCATDSNTYTDTRCPISDNATTGTVDPCAHTAHADCIACHANPTAICDCCQECAVSGTALVCA